MPRRPALIVVTPRHGPWRRHHLALRSELIKIVPRSLCGQPIFGWTWTKGGRRTWRSGRMPYLSAGRGDKPIRCAKCDALAGPAS